MSSTKVTNPLFNPPCGRRGGSYLGVPVTRVVASLEHPFNERWQACLSSARGSSLGKAAGVAGKRAGYDNSLVGGGDFIGLEYKAARLALCWLLGWIWLAARIPTLVGVSSDLGKSPVPTVAHRGSETDCEHKKQPTMFDMGSVSSTDRPRNTPHWGAGSK